MDRMVDDEECEDVCLHQNLAERTRKLEGSKIVSSRNRSDVDRYRLVLMQYRNWLFYRWTTYGWRRGKICRTLQKGKD